MGRWRSAEQSIARWMLRHAATCARTSLGLVFAWFGMLKLFHASPAAPLIARLVERAVDPAWFTYLLGVWEVAIGVCLVVGTERSVRLGLLLLFAQMPGTFLPVVVIPEAVFARAPFELTLEGQYIAKNFVLISAALVVGGALYRQGASHDPDTATRTAGRWLVDPGSSARH